MGKVWEWQTWTSRDLWVIDKPWNVLVSLLDPTNSKSFEGGRSPRRIVFNLKRVLEVLWARQVWSSILRQTEQIILRNAKESACPQDLDYELERGASGQRDFEAEGQYKSDGLEVRDGRLKSTWLDRDYEVVVQVLWKWRQTSHKKGFGPLTDQTRPGSGNGNCLKHDFHTTSRHQPWWAIHSVDRLCKDVYAGGLQICFAAENRLNSKVWARRHRQWLSTETTSVQLHKEVKDARYW
mgnify:CR=1 FL=1